MPLQRHKRLPAERGYGPTGARLDSRPMDDSGGHAAARILVVDDEPSIRLLCRVNLELEGYEVLEASSLATARATLEGDAVDVVILDVHLRSERSDGPGNGEGPARAAGENPRPLAFFRAFVVRIDPPEITG